jgi:hypothetical protein
VKRIYSIFLALLLISVFFSENSYACSTYISPLKERFRKAETVFVGTVDSVELYPPGRNWALDGLNRYSVRFKTTKTWKGAEKGAREYVLFEAACDCDGRSEVPKLGKEYLFMPDKDPSVCDAVAADTERGRNEIKRLDRFWFRTWATFYPF